MKSISRTLSHKFQALFQSFLRNSNNAPYLSGDTFKSLADISIERGTLIDRELEIELNNAEIIFFESHTFIELYDSVRDYIKKPHILIMGNSDYNFESSPRVSNTCIRVYCQNPGFQTDSRRRFLPIGVENLRLAGSGFKRFLKFNEIEKRDDKILVTPLAPTNHVRTQLLSYVTKNERIFRVERKRLSRKKYFRLIENYKFVLAPEGNGFDTHRLWEILYKGSIPVVMRTSWSQNLEKLGLPIFFYSSIEEVDLNELRRFGDRHYFKPQDIDMLWINYWKEEICSLL